jgi:hypothetical protein
MLLFKHEKVMAINKDEVPLEYEIGINLINDFNKEKIHADLDVMGLSKSFELKCFMTLQNRQP